MSSDIRATWATASKTFRGLTQYTLPRDPTEAERYMRDTLAAVRRGLERDWCIECEALRTDRILKDRIAAELTWRSLKRIAPKLRAARGWDLFVALRPAELMIAAE